MPSLIFMSKKVVFEANKFDSNMRYIEQFCHIMSLCAQKDDVTLIDHSNKQFLDYIYQKKTFDECHQIFQVLTKAQFQLKYIPYFQSSFKNLKNLEISVSTSIFEEQLFDFPLGLEIFKIKVKKDVLDFKQVVTDINLINF